MTSRAKVFAVIKIVGVIFCFQFFSSGLKAQVASDFSASADGWTALNGGSPASVTYNSTGGNPTGNISFNLSSPTTNVYWVAPSKFNHNLSSAYNQNLTFDLLQSAAGSDNTNNDIVISSGANTLVYQLPTKPGITWTSYSIQLNETVSGWHLGNYLGAAPTQVQMKQVLANITTFQIRLKYSNISTSYTAQLDNVVLNLLPVGPYPTITSFSPLVAYQPSQVIIFGTNFNSVASLNHVYFNGIQGTVYNAQNTQLSVTTPTSAVFGPITVVNAGTNLEATSTQSFNPEFNNNLSFGGRIIPASFSRGYNTVIPMSASASNGFGKMDKGDFDGDGWIDLVTTETSTAKIYAFQNLGTGGTVSTSSFGAAITLPSLSGVPGGGPSLNEIIVVDVDNDGKLDVAASTSGNLSLGTGFLAVYRNTSTPGSISFASPLFFAYNYYSALYMATGDLDGDGRTDFAFTTGSSPGNIFINQNLSTPGNIDFSFGVNIGPTPTSGLSDIAIADLSGDGKPEIICPGYNAATISIYQNNSTPGTISMGAAFTIPSVVSYTNQVAVADLDADGKLDMVWSTYGAQYVYFAKNIYSGGTFDATAFGPTIQIKNTLSNPLGINVGDVNSDGKPDVILSGYTDLAVMQNIGTGSLSSSSFLPTTLFQGSANSTFIGGISPGLADLDGDNKPEAFFVSSSSSLPAGFTGIYIFHNESFPLPTITSASPTSAFAGATVALNGSLMYTGNTTPSIRLNKLLAPTSGSPTNTLTSITTPTSSISGKFNLTNHGLTTVFNQPFVSSFNTNRVITSSTFGSSVDFALTYGVKDVLETGDFDDDGKTDVVISDGSGVVVFQNSNTVGQPISTSSLTKFGTVFSSGGNVAVSDIDGDGKTDINTGFYILQNTSAGSISFGSNVYSPATPSGGQATADFNQDGKLDIAFTNGSINVSVFENLSSRGTFVNNGATSTYNSTPVPLAHPSSNAFGPGNNSIVAADFDGDGFNDIAALSSASTSVILFRNLGVTAPISGSSFSTGTSIATQSSPSGITSNDFDGDGMMDIAVVHYNTLASNSVYVYLNKSSAGSISFAAPIQIASPTFGYCINSQDLDGDGKPEIMTARNPNPGTPSFSIFQNTSSPGSLSFGAVVTFTTTRYPQALAFADINSDQKPDILIVGYSGLASPASALMVFQNMMVTPVISINTQPSNSAVCNGATAQFTVAASGTTNINYQWQYSTDGILPYTDISNTGGYSNVATSALSVNTTGNFGAGFYRCRVNGDFAAQVISSSASLTVNALPAAPIVPLPFSSCGPLSLVLGASGGSAGNYIWYDPLGNVIAGQTNATYITPVLSATTQYFVAITNGTCTSAQTTVNAIIYPVPAAPSVQGASNCGPGSVTLAASGGSNGNYVWFTASGTSIPGQFNATFTTPLITATTQYAVAIATSQCISTQASANATINPVPTAPTIQDASGCTGGSLTLTASGGTNGQYVWYTVPTGGTAIAGQANSTFTTPALTTTTTYYVSINNGACESARTPVIAAVSTTGCSVPVIATQPLVTQIGGTVTLNLVPLIATPNSTLNLASLEIVTPSGTGNTEKLASGATASIDASGVLTINYTGISFSGTETISVQACDSNGNCATQLFSIDVAGDIIVYNGISPNGKNPSLILEYINLLPDTKNNTVFIFDRWENQVWHGANYDNSSVVFTGVSDGGSDLPSGVYFYKINFAGGRKPLTGFISLRR